ncbi:MAG: UDP-N-acetylmuramate--L-alanine ligase [Proteobacteria bacterium]|nr:UDP-N-acetylmuramate--L-alanine ligase [Pseudomonadota bacterium]
MVNKRPQTADWSISDLNPEQPIHFAGIAGSAMSGLAMLLHERGFRVVGTDPRADQLRAYFEAAGIAVHEQQDGSKIPLDAGLVVTTAALPSDHPELVKAADRDLRIVRYAEFLGALMAESDGIAVAGTHGKTTTSAMIVSILKSAGISPSFVIGGVASDLGTNAGNGSSRVFVAEACEYNRSFLNLAPKTAVITNIEQDHMDIYANLAEIIEAFSMFASTLQQDGVLVHSIHCQNTTPILADLQCRKISFGVETEADYSARNTRTETGETVFTLIHKGIHLSDIRLNMPGRHNVANALAAIAVCSELDIPVDRIARALSVFKGVRRRFEIRGEAHGVVVIDDYAHHPTEIRALLEGAETRFPGQRLVIAFQPHQCCRTRLLFDEFARSFDRADIVVIPDIYSVRESDKERERINSDDLVKQIIAGGADAKYTGSLDSTVDHLLKILKPDDVLLTVGAGDIDQIVDNLLKRLADKA